MYGHLTSPFPLLKQCVHRKPGGVLAGIVKDDYVLLTLFEPGSQSGTAVVEAEKVLKRCRKDKELYFYPSVSHW